VGAAVAAGGDADPAGRPDADVAGALLDASEVALAPGPGLAGRRETSSTAATTTMAAIVTVAASREFERFVLVTQSR